MERSTEGRAAAAVGVGPNLPVSAHEESQYDFPKPTVSTVANASLNCLCRRAGYGGSKRSAARW